MNYSEVGSNALGASSFKFEHAFRLKRKDGTYRARKAVLLERRRRNIRPAVT